VVHTFLGVVPALALGVPDPAMAAGALPGHRLVVEGRGEEALRLSALGSTMAVALAVPLAVPVTMAMTTLYPHVVANLSFVLGGVALAMVLTEPTWAARLGRRSPSVRAWRSASSPWTLPSPARSAGPR